jgi:hypothetical protein
MGTYQKTAFTIQCKLCIKRYRLVHELHKCSSLRAHIAASRHARHCGPGEARFGLWVSTRQRSPRRAGPDHALDLWYGVTLHIFIHGPDPTQTTHAVSYHGLHRGPYHSHDVGGLIVFYVLCTMSSMLWYPMHRTITSTVLRMGEVGCPTTPAHSSIITPSSHDS